MNDVAVPRPLPKIGDPAPDFKAVTTHGEIEFSKWAEGKWVVFFSHPADFTPVCSTELTEFGRRVKENGSGTDHGSGGVAFVIGDAVKGGLYGEYPSLAPEKLDEGDLQWNNDFRSTYATLLEQWLGLDSKAILRGSFEQFDFIK